MKKELNNLFAPIEKSNDPFEEIYVSLKEVSLGLRVLSWKKRLQLIWKIISA